jgi:hypothetical protein
MTTGTGTPFSRVGLNSHCRTASGAASSSIGTYRRPGGVTVRSRRAWPIARPRSFTVGIASACFKTVPILVRSLRDNAACFECSVSSHAGAMLPDTSLAGASSPVPASNKLTP